MNAWIFNIECPVILINHVLTFEKMPRITIFFHSFVQSRILFKCHFQPSETSICVCVWEKKSLQVSSSRIEVADKSVRRLLNNVHLQRLQIKNSDNFFFHEMYIHIRFFVVFVAVVPLESFYTDPGGSALNHKTTYMRETLKRSPEVAGRIGWLLRHPKRQWQITSGPIFDRHHLIRNIKPKIQLYNNSLIH